MKDDKTITTIKIIGGIGVLGVGTYFLKRYLDNKAENEIIQAEQKKNLTNAVKGSKSLLPIIIDVNKELKNNPKLQSFTKSEYLNFADNIYNSIKKENYNSFLDTFKNLKTNTDLKLLNIYFGIKVYKRDNIFQSYELSPLNLSQSISKFVPGYIQKKLTDLLNSKKITYKLF